MGGRYLVTGVQLAMLKLKHDKDLVNEIIENQFVWDSDKDIDKDVEQISKEKHQIKKV